jgi:cephalosporin-C deacetylase-like acetyl esterase
MVGPPEIHDPSKFDDFHVHHVTYKVVSGHPIDLSILVPKLLVENGELSEKTPLITEFHGGFLVGGNRIFSPWFSNWSV